MNYLAMVCFQSPPRALGCRIDGVCGTGDYPPPDLPRETARSRSASKKVCNLDPMAPRSRQKRQLPEGPQ